MGRILLRGLAGIYTVKAFLFLLCLSLVLPTSSFGQSPAVGPAGTLLRAYGGSCPAVVTRQVHSSLASIEGLINVIEQMRDDSNCFGAQEVLDIARRYQRLFEDYQVYAHTREDRRELERKIQLYTSMLSDPNLSSTQANFLEQELLFAQSDLVTIEGRMGRFEGLKGRHARGASELISSVESYFSIWSQSPQCMESGAQLWTSLVSNGMLAAAAFSGPGTSIALAGGAVLAQSLGHYVKNYRTNRSLGRIDDIQWPTALRCVSQAMTDQFCQSHETQLLISDYRFSRSDTDSRLEGVELLSRHLNQLDHWLQEVFAGSAITSQGDLVNREKPILQAELLQKVRRYTETYGTIRQDTYRSISDALERSDAVAIGISNLVSIMESPTLNPAPSSPFSGGSSSEVENPIFISRDKQTLPYTLFDSSINSVPLCDISPCSSLRAYVNDRGIRLTMSDWNEALRNALSVIDETLEGVNLMRARTVSVDAFSVLVRANADHRGESNALRGLVKIIDNAERIKDYLTEVGCRQNSRDCETVDGEVQPRLTHRYFPQIQNTHKTKELTQTVLELIEEGFRPRTLSPDHLPAECQARSDNSARSTLLGSDFDEQEVKSFQITSCITNILKLAERGNDVYFRKIRDMVAYELEARFVHDDFADEVRDIVYSTRADLVQTLVDTFSSDVARVGLAEVVTGLETAMQLNVQTLEEFGVVFEKPIEGLLEDAHQLSTGQRNDLCFRILPLLNESEQELMEMAYQLCHSVEMNFYADGPTLKWSDFVVERSRRTVLGNRRNEYFFTTKANLEGRYCSLRAYYRDNMLIEQQMRRDRKSDQFSEEFSFLDFLL